MKLYLPSQKFGNNTMKLISLCWQNKNVAVIANALDNMPKNHRQWRVQMEFENLKLLWFIPEELDLRKYFNNPKGLQIFLSKKSMVWVRGGSAFILNRAMIQSGFNTIGVEMIKNSEIVYAWYSAALIVATKSLIGTEIVDDPKIIPDGYSKNTNPFLWLGLIDFYLIPHIDSKEDWAKNIPLCVKKLQEKKENIVTLKDEESFIINDEIYNHDFRMIINNLEKYKFI